MPGHSAHSSDRFEPPLPTGKYYPPIYEKRHRNLVQIDTEQTIYTNAGRPVKVDMQVRAYVTESLRAIVAKDETRRRMLQYPRYLAAQHAPMAPEASAEVELKICLDRAPREYALSPKLRPQGSSGTVSPLELDAATVD